MCILKTQALTILALKSERNNTSDTDTIRSGQMYCVSPDHYNIVYTSIMSVRHVDLRNVVHLCRSDSSPGTTGQRLSITNAHPFRKTHNGRDNTNVTAVLDQNGWKLIHQRIAVVRNQIPYASQIRNLPDKRHRWLIRPITRFPITLRFESLQLAANL